MSSSSSISSVSSINSDVEERISRSSSTSSIENAISKQGDEIIIKSMSKDITPKCDNITPKSHTNLLQKIADNQLYGSIIIMSLLFSLDIVIPQDWTNKFTHLQYKYPNLELYDIGLNDIYFVLNWIIILTFIRSIVMDFILGPIGTKFSKITNPKTLQRYKEQGWSLFYYTTSWSIGFYLYYNSDYYLNCEKLWLNWPHDKLTKNLKMYYLIQLSCWLQQIVVLNVEEKRKDYVQMFSHHVVTCLLVTGSYYYYFTHVGHVILVLMDFVDILLPLAKMLKYSGYTTVCDAIFLLFLFNWTLLRHGAYNYIVYNAQTKGRYLLNGNCERFQLENIIPKRCYTDFAIDIFISLLCILQIITLMWMYFILRVLYRVIKGGGADDVRSDSEDE